MAFHILAEIDWNQNNPIDVTNLLLQSNGFDAGTIWTPASPGAGAVIDKSQPGPLGGQRTGWRIEDTDIGNTFTLVQPVSFVGAIGMTFSVYVKEVSSPICELSFDWGGFVVAKRFEFATETLLDAPSSGPADAESVEDVGGGWYRISVSIQGAGVSTAMTLAPCESGIGGADPTSVGETLFFGAQLNEGVGDPLPYVETVATPVAATVNVLGTEPARYADIALVVPGAGADPSIGYEGKIITVGQIVKSAGARLSTVTIDLDNTSRIDARFADLSPPENSEARIYIWFEGDNADQRIELFRGIIERVTAVNDERLVMQLASTEESVTRLIGHQITSDEYPLASPKALGKIEPIVLGTVEASDCPNTVTLGSSKTATTMLSQDLFVNLEDTSTFPTTGTIRIGDEVITYTGKTDSQLTGLARGVGTSAGSYGSGQTVVGVGVVEYVAAQHAVVSIENVYAVLGDRSKLLSPSTYAAVLTGPSKLTFSEGIPTVPVPAGTTQFTQTQFEQEGPASTANGGDLACGANPDFTQKNSARISESNPLLELERLSDLNVFGEAVRTWLAFEFDNRELIAMIANLDTVEGAIFDGTNETVLGPFVEGGNLPLVVLDRAEGILARAFDDTHEHDVTGGSDVQVRVSPVVVTGLPSLAAFTFHPPFWQPSNLQDPPATIDGSDGSNETMETPTGPLPSSGVMYNLRASDFSAYTPAGGRALTKFRARCHYGDISGGFDNPANLVLKVGGATQSSTVIAGDSGIAGATFFSPFFVTADINKLRTAEVFVGLRGGGIGDPTWRCWNIEIEATEADTGDQTSEEEPLEHTRAMLFDISNAATPGISLRDHTIRARFQGAASARELSIIRGYYLVEFSALNDEPAERIVATVEGLIPNGDTADIVEQIVTHPVLLGLPISRLNTARLATAQTRLQAVGHILGFTLTKAIEGTTLLANVATQSRLHQWWDKGALYVAFKEAPADFPAPALTFGVNDIVPDSLARFRTPLRDVVNIVAFNYHRSEKTQTTERIVEVEGVQVLGPRKSESALEFIRDDNTAQTFAEFVVARNEVARFTIEFQVYLPGIEVELADVVRAFSPQFDYSKVEIVSTQALLGSDPPTVLLRGIVFDSI